MSRVRATVKRWRRMTRATVSLAAGVMLGVLVVLVAPSGPAGAQAACVPTVTYDLYAVTGSMTTLPGIASVNVYGYNTSNATVSQPGGPTLTVNQDAVVGVTLHNQLTGPGSGPTSLLFQGQDVIPDLTGATTGGGTSTYCFTASRPGTYLYEAGLLPNAQHQVAMGLYGALIVRPTGFPASPGQAYAPADSAFTHDHVLLLSEIDPALNNLANPAGFDMRRYAPRYFLINGEVYPETDPIPSAIGDDVLLRYVNAGNQYHSMGVQGTHQTVIALDGSPLDFSRDYVAETIGPGQTLDAIVKVPTSASAQSLAIHDGNLLLHNTNQVGSGGMLTFLTAPGAAVDTGPVTTNVAYGSGALTATIADPPTAQTASAGAEFFMDAVSAPGTGISMAAADASFDSPTEAVTALVSVPAGQHIFYVRGRDTAGNWGVVSSVLVEGADAVGPTTRSATLTPDVTNSAAVAVHATGDDSTTGGSNIDAAEYSIGAAAAAAGSGTSMTVSQAAPIVSLDASIPPATIAGLPEGTNLVWIRSHDAAGNWGAAISANLVIDRTSPVTSAVSAVPSPNNGLIPFNPSTPAVRVTATLTDVGSRIRSAEGFIDAVGANGTGFPLAANDGVFDGSMETGIADIPLATIRQLTNGNHTIYVHARDEAGNWGAATTTILVIDKAAPVLTGLTATPNPTLSATLVTLAASATDAGGAPSVTQAEWFTGADPGQGSATSMTISGTGPWALSATIDVSNWNEGTYTIRARARDSVGNWSTPVTTTLVVTRPIFFSTAGNTNPPGVGGTSDDADIYLWNGAVFSRSTDVTAITNPLPTGANVDGLDRVSATQFYLSFDGTVTIALPGPDLTVQDEDVVLYNAGTWSVFFDGTPAATRGLGGSDLDAINVVGGILYFSTTDATVPVGVAGAGDDADIYSWNGASFARVVNANGGGSLGLPAGADVDGFVRIDATHFLMSFNDNVTIPVPGPDLAVQDEDVVYFSAGTWSVYFDGTLHGLTSGNLDVDAFDVP